MKLANTLLAIALPLALSAGCAMDVGSNAEALTVDTNPDFGINACGQTTARWLGEADWPIDTIVAGDMELTKGELVEYTETHPGARADLIAEIAAAQLNMTVGLIIPDGVVEDLIAADDVVMAPDTDTGTPPPVNIDDFGDLRDFNAFANLDCFTGGGDVAQEVLRTVDTRDDLVEPEPDQTRDFRPNLVTEN